MCHVANQSHQYLRTNTYKFDEFTKLRDGFNFYQDDDSRQQVVKTCIREFSATEGSVQQRVQCNNQGFRPGFRDAYRMEGILLPRLLPSDNGIAVCYGG